jgi:hypothetical protein
MRRVNKDPKSQILALKLKYIEGNSANNKRIADILFTEQLQFCAYTDEHLSRTDARDIEHFNPSLKGTDNDGYANWFLVKHQWNKEKSYKWYDFQPALHPTSPDFETRVVYLDGDYVSISESDTEAINLIKLLKLDDPGLADKRKRYIKRKRNEIAAFGKSAADFFSVLLEDDRCQVSYPRAIQEEFDFDVIELLKNK